MYPNIEAERARKGMTMQELADELNVDRKTLYNWRHSGNIPADKLAQMAKMFGVSINYLIQR